MGFRAIQWFWNPEIGAFRNYLQVHSELRLGGFYANMLSHDLNLDSI